MLRYILRHIVEESRPPTLTQIAKACGFHGPAGATCHLKPLVKKGAILREKGKACGIKPLPAAWEWFKAEPILAEAAA